LATILIVVFNNVQGWNKSHDEWLSHDKLLKKTPESELLAKKMADEIKKIQAETKARKKGGASSLKDAKGCVSRAKGKDGVKSVDLTIDLDAESDKANKIVIPQHLKKQLILDWESITRKQMLVPLPRQPCIDELLDQYCKEQTSDAARHLQTEICSGLKTYFNRALPTVLLYRFERPQWKAMIEKHKDWALTRIYGSEHLCLFVHPK
jgi:mortality factor 4-like protein 1